MNPRRYDRLRSQLHTSIREGDAIIQPFRDDLRAIGFDLDWTLSYYPVSLQQVWQEAASRCSFPVALLGDLDSLARRYNELWLDNERAASSKEALRLHITTSLLDELGTGNPEIALKLAQAFGDIRNETGIAAYPGVAELLADLTKEYKLALYTNGPSDIQWEKIHALGFDQLMDVILVAGDIGIYKPDLRGFTLLLEQLDEAAKHVLFVGDNYDADIAGAHNAGMYTAWVTDTEGTVIDSVQPTIIISAAAQLREALL